MKWANPAVGAVQTDFLESVVGLLSKTNGAPIRLQPVLLETSHQLAVAARDALSLVRKAGARSGSPCGSHTRADVVSPRPRRHSGPLLDVDQRKVEPASGSGAGHEAPS